MKEKMLTILVIMFFFYSSFSQNLISSQSGVIETNSMIIEWTLGENFTKTIRFHTKTITEGFIQPYKKTLGSKEIKWANAMVYPNPAQSEIYFKTTSELSISFEIALYDIYGKMISKNLHVIGRNPLRIDVNMLPYGVYLLHINDKKSNHFGVYKFIKN